MSTRSDAQLSVELSRLAAGYGAVLPDTPSHAIPSADAPPADAPPATEQLLAAVASCHNLVRISTDLQGQAVRAAHDAGVSWAKIGKTLGTSRQAVQQRFDPHYLPGSASDGASGGVSGGVSGQARHGATRILGPVSRSEEMHHLAAAGSQGWRLIRALHGEHVLERDDRPWEIKRVSVLSARPMPSARDGWQAAATRFPDCFYIRPLQPEGPEA